MMFLKATSEFLKFSKIHKCKNKEKNLHISLSPENLCYEVEG